MAFFKLLILQIGLSMDLLQTIILTAQLDYFIRCRFPLGISA